MVFNCFFFLLITTSSKLKLFCCSERGFHRDSYRMLRVRSNFGSFRTKKCSLHGQRDYLHRMDCDSSRLSRDRMAVPVADRRQIIHGLLDRSGERLSEHLHGRNIQHETARTLHDVLINFLLRRRVVDLRLRLYNESEFSLADETDLLEIVVIFRRIGGWPR